MEYPLKAKCYFDVEGTYFRALPRDIKEYCVLPYLIAVNDPYLWGTDFVQPQLVDSISLGVVPQYGQYCLGPQGKILAGATTWTHSIIQSLDPRTRQVSPMYQTPDTPFSPCILHSYQGDIHRLLLEINQLSTFKRYSYSVITQELVEIPSFEGAQLADPPICLSIGSTSIYYLEESQTIQMDEGEDEVPVWVLRLSLYGEEQVEALLYYGGYLMVIIRNVVRPIGMGAYDIARVDFYRILA